MRTTVLSHSQGSDGTIPVNSRTGTHTQSVSRTSSATFYGHSLTLTRANTHIRTQTHTGMQAGTKRTPKIIGRKEVNARTYVHILLQILPESERERERERERTAERDCDALSLSAAALFIARFLF